MPPDLPLRPLHRSGDASGRTYTFDHYRLAGRATVRIHTGGGRDTRTDLYQDRRNYVWDNHSDTATLRNDHSRFITTSPGATTTTTTAATPATDIAHRGRATAQASRPRT